VREHTYLAIELIDESGLVVPFDDRVLRVEVSGDVRLLGLGSARPATEDGYVGDSCRTYLGRAQAIVRRAATGVGEVVVHAAGLAAARVAI
jgi:beta-galactosidase